MHLDDDNLCRLFGQQSRPKFCREFSAHVDICGHSNAEAIELITVLEKQTS